MLGEGAMEVLEREVESLCEEFNKNPAEIFMSMQTLKDRGSNNKFLDETFPGQLKIVN